MLSTFKTVIFVFRRLLAIVEFHRRTASLGLRHIDQKRPSTEAAAPVVYPLSAIADQNSLKFAIF